MELSVIIPSHQPHRERLARTLAGLRSQTLPVDRWETVLALPRLTARPAARGWHRSRTDLRGV
jgi:hypothetical protein